MKKKSLFSFKNILGVCLVLFGLSLFLGRYFDISSGWLWGFFWPILIIAIGINALVKNPLEKSGIYITGIGVLIFIAHLFHVGFWSLFLPALFISIGFFMIYDQFGWRKKGKDNEESFDHTVIFSGLDKRITAKNFKEGKITAICAGAKIDFKEGQFEAKKIELNVSAIFGGVEVIVPDNMKVENEVDAILGGVEDKTRRTDKTEMVLKLTGEAICGGVEIKN